MTTDNNYLMIPYADTVKMNCIVCRITVFHLFTYDSFSLSLEYHVVPILLAFEPCGVSACKECHSHCFNVIVIKGETLFDCCMY